MSKNMGKCYTSKHLADFFIYENNELKEKNEEKEEANQMGSFMI